MPTPSELAHDGAFLLEEATIMSLTNHERDGQHPTPFDVGKDINVDSDVILAIMRQLETANRVQNLHHRGGYYWTLTDVEREIRNHLPDLAAVEDWEAEVKFGPTSHNGDVRINDQLWMAAIFHHGPSVQELIKSPRLEYIAPFETYFTVAYQFRLEFPNDALVAYVTAHPVQQFPGGDHKVDNSATIAEVTATIRFRSIRTREAVRRYIAMLPE